MSTYQLPHLDVLEHEAFILSGEPPRTPLLGDKYSVRRQTGAILLVDEFTPATVAAGMIY